MKDFTKKGTKLPVIPVGTEYLTGLMERKWESHYCKEPLYSHGETLRRGEVYIKSEKKNYNQNDDFYLIKLSTIERLAKEQGMCNTNNKTMKVTLQENGEVTVTDTETTTTLSKVTVDEICRLVKEKDSPKLEVGNWYHYIGGLYVWNNGNQTYGFNSQKRFDDHYSFSTSDGAVEATPETVEQYLREEAVKRGFVKGTKYKHIKFDTVKVLKKPENLKLILHNDCNNLTDGCGGSIFDNGVWATIIQPETITRAEAEKRYDVKITD